MVRHVCCVLVGFAWPLHFRTWAGWPSEGARGGTSDAADEGGVLLAGEGQLPGQLLEQAVAHRVVDVVRPALVRLPGGRRRTPGRRSVVVRSTVIGRPRSLLNGSVACRWPNHPAAESSSLDPSPPLFVDRCLGIKIHSRHFSALFSAVKPSGREREANRKVDGRSGLVSSTPPTHLAGGLVDVIKTIIVVKFRLVQR